MDTIFSNIGYSHIEKVNRIYKGSYQILIKEYCTYLYTEYNVKVINRQDNLGLDGLRKNKLSYNPEYFIEKDTLILSYNYVFCISCCFEPQCGINLFYNCIVL